MTWEQSSCKTGSSVREEGGPRRQGILGRPEASSRQAQRQHRPIAGLLPCGGRAEGGECKSFREDTPFTSDLEQIILAPGSYQELGVLLLPGGVLFNAFCHLCSRYPPGTQHGAPDFLNCYHCDNL